jgi:hypothetical protein
MWGLPPWREIPIALRIYAAVTVVAGVVVATTVTWSKNPGLAVFVVAVLLALVFLLLRASRAAWWLLMASFVFSIATAPFESPRWWTILVSTFGAVCLLWPSSRAYVLKPQPVQYPPPLASAIDSGPTDAVTAVQTSWDPEAESDLERPSGWYVDREEPGRMHYWSADQSGWSGSTKTPKKIFAEWDRN